jgi:hypothetical protein
MGVANELILKNNSKQFGHANRLGLDITDATPDRVSNRQAFRSFIISQEHGQEQRHAFSMIFADKAPTKATCGTGFFFAAPTFHNDAS